ncbi:beta-lactam antibiotic acylase [Sulfolobales archaeon HS-7]|nr:beta-lactam antibiotic acylase [Sulfolobales archaeon HS-7]
MKWWILPFIGAIIAVLVILSSPFSILNPYMGIWSEASIVTRSEVLNLPKNLTYDGIFFPTLKRPVRIEVTDNGEGVILAKDPYDLYFGEGYYQASQRLFEMEFFGLVASGNVSSWVGEEGLNSDLAMHLIGIPYNANLTLNCLRMKYPVIYSYLEAFSNGVNAYISQLNSRDEPLCFRLLHAKPYLWSPYYTLAFAEFMAWGLTSGFSGEIQSAMIYASFNYSIASLLNPYYPYFTNGNITMMPGDGTINGYNLTDQGVNPSYLWSLNWYQDWAIGIPKSTLQSIIPLMNYSLNNISDPLTNFIDFGSNSWVVSGNKSTTGFPILANDPHLTLYFPSVWIQVWLMGGGYNVSGWALAGIPGVLIGHTNQTAWGLTTPFGASSDAYLEVLKGNDYLYEGNYLPMKHVSFVLLGKKYSVYYTNNGPLVAREGNYGISLYWPAQQSPMTTVVAEFLLDNSTSFADLLRAAELWNFPPQNMALVGRHNFGIINAGTYPLINETLPDGRNVMVIGSRGPLNGSSGRYEPVGFVPFKYLPQTIDPERGYAFAPNQPTAWVNYPFPLIGGYWVSDGRALDVYHYLSVVQKLSISNMMGLQGNVTDYWSYLLKPYLVNSLKGMNMSGLESKAYSYLQEWNSTFYQGEVGPTVYTYLIAEMVNTSLNSFLLKKGIYFYTQTSDSYIPSLFLYLAINQPNSTLFNGNFTFFVRENFAREISFLSLELNQNVSSWTWGKVHYVEFYSPLGITALSLGPYPEWGDSFTLSAGYFPYVLQVPLPYVTIGPSLRFIASPGSDQFYGVFPGGSTENILSPLAYVQLNKWLDFEYYNMNNVSVNYTITLK